MTPFEAWKDLKSKYQVSSFKGFSAADKQYISDLYDGHLYAVAGFMVTKKINGVGKQSIADFLKQFTVYNVQAGKKELDIVDITLFKEINKQINPSDYSKIEKAIAGYILKESNTNAKNILLEISNVLVGKEQLLKPRKEEIKKDTIQYPVITAINSKQLKIS